MNDEKPNIDVVKDLIKSRASWHRGHVKRCQEADRYYRNKNDILKQSVKGQDYGPLRNADNRIPRNFHGLLVNQKAAYMFAAPPLFDIGKEEANKQIADILGDSYAKHCKDLCVNASNHECSWIHYWRDDKGNFCYGIVSSEQIIPVYSNDLDKALIAVLRTYKDIDFATGKEITIWEYWDREKCYSYYRTSSTVSIAGLSEYNVFQGVPEDGTAEKSNVFVHGWGDVPFIPFNNNNISTNDLVNIKLLVDAYDKVFTGFLNDLEDIQEVIFILTNYGGEDKKEFIDDLKKYKMIKLDDDGDDSSKTGVETLTISIPIEAREKFLEMTRKAIFEQGQGVDPDPQKFGNASGEALKYLYSLLELKAGLMETEFKQGFGRLVRAICKYLGAECGQIIQTWARSAIRSDSELADICEKSVGVISNKTILKNHPFVENADEEEKQLEKEKAKAAEEADEYRKAFQKQAEENPGGEIDGEEE
ncbi:MAG: phage portal protein [Hungatella sp.]|jgi:SPP1 family phage portal protein|nr:phage portal protein [Hungatella sp.]